MNGFESHASLQKFNAVVEEPGVLISLSLRKSWVQIPSAAPVWRCMEHKPIICRRCSKEIADEGVRNKMDEKEYHKKYCECPFHHDSAFTSRPQPPNLEMIER